MIESKPFYRKIEAAFSAAGGARTPARFAERVGPHLLAHLGGPLGVVTVQLYECRAGAVSRRAGWGEAFPDLAGLLCELLHADDERAIVELPWAGELHATRVGLLPVDEDRDGPMLVLVTANPGELRAVPSRGELLSVLNSLRYAIRQHLHRSELEDLFEQARAVQVSLLPDGRPVFDGYDICAASVPAQSVGGDLYDFLALDADLLAIAVADASGHGLPAALQARDVVTGLRMGVERDLKVTRMIEKLNRVVHRSGLSSRFVSLVFGELERNGNFSYVNAGHPPPLLLDDRGVTPLTVGGMILGPAPDSSYKLGFAHLDHGSVLALFSDGVPEHGAMEGRPFGEDGVAAWLEAWRDGPADAAVDDLLARLRAHGGGEPFEDDVTAVMVRRAR